MNTNNKSFESHLKKNNKPKSFFENLTYLPKSIAYKLKDRIKDDLEDLMFLTYDFIPRNKMDIEVYSFFINRVYTIIEGNDVCLDADEFLTKLGYPQQKEDTDDEFTREYYYIALYMSPTIQRIYSISDDILNHTEDKYLKLNQRIDDVDIKQFREDYALDYRMSKEFQDNTMYNISVMNKLHKHPIISD